MKFIIPGKVQGKARARTFFDAKIDKYKSITPEKTTNFENLVRYCFVQAGGKKTDKPIRITVKIFIDIPSSMPKKVQVQALAGLVVPVCKPDNDNIEKIIFDALNGFAYKDDIQIVENASKKYYSTEARTEVFIEEVSCQYYRQNGKWIINEY